MTDNLFVGEEARTKLMVGIQKVATAVGQTLGTSGSNSIIEVIENPQHYVTNDGYSIANAIRLADPIEEMGRKILVEAINRANRQSGDGSSTTCVLTQAILEEGIKHLQEASPMEIKKSLEDCIPLIEASVKDQKKDITVDTVAQVASISAEDESIGNMIQEIYQQIGKDGIIQWDISKTAEDSYTIGSGLTINGATYAAPYMADENSTEIRLENPYMLLVRKKITTALDFEVLFPMLFQQEIREVVIFCDDIDVQVIADLYKTQRIRGFRTVVIKMPVLWRDEWWEDLAIASGGTLVDVASGIKLNEVQMQHLGQVKHLTVTKEDTLIDGIHDMSSQIMNLQAEGSDRSQLRASRLNTRTARYYVGAHSESALAYRRLKLEDALNSASCALQNGVVAGGGVALENATEKLDDSIGGKILKVALQLPQIKIAKNAGITQWGRPGPSNIGLDSRTGKMVDMFEAGIVDATDVVLNSIRNAIGVAAAVLTVGTVVTLPREEPIQTPQNMVQR